MSRSIINWGLIGTKLVLLSCFEGLTGFTPSCFENPNEIAQTDIIELVASSDYSSFEILRSTKIDRGNTKIPYQGDLHYFKYSLGGEYASFFSYDRPRGKKVINYGSAVENYSSNFGPFLTTDGVLSPKNGSIGDIEINTVSYPISYLPYTDALISNYIIVLSNIHSSTVDTLQIGHKPYYTDSISVRSNYLENLNFDDSGNLLAISATLDSKVELVTILWGASYRNVIKKITDTSFIRINSENDIDTLFNFPAFTDSISSPILNGLDDYYNFEFEPTKHGIFVKRNGNVHLLNETIKELSEPLYTGDLPIRISPNGKYALNRTQLINLQTKDVIELSEKYSSYQIGDISNTELVLTHRDSESIAIIDIESMDLVEEITLVDLPKFQEFQLVDYDRKLLTEPIFNENEELIFILARHSRQLDPNYDCYD